MRSMIGAGALALALGLSACGASPNTPAGGASGPGVAEPQPTSALEVQPTSVPAMGDSGSYPVPAAGGDTVVDAALADPRFSTLASLLQASGLSQQLAQAGPFTIFAPTNEAFAELPAGTLEALAQEPALLQEILLYHVAAGELTSADVAASTSATTQAGSEIAISAQGDTVTLNGSAQVIEPDIEVGNGVIHVIDEVLLPPDVNLPAAG